ncbi:MAG TPA: hypothetical protein V6D17_11655 [Candidatus Obscuribacterales bacterium]
MCERSESLSSKVAEGKLSPVESLSILYPEDIPHAEARLARRILGNYSTHLTQNRRDFIENLTRDSVDFVKAKKRRDYWPTTEEAAMTQSMMAVVDEVFEVLEPYVSRLNQALDGTVLNVTLTHPSQVNEIVDHDHLRRPVATICNYRARISTARLSVVVRGQNNRVDFFLLPADRVMGLSKVEDEHKPLMTFCGTAGGANIDWEVEGKPLTRDRLERYTLLLFEHLMERTREEMEAIKGRVNVAC